MSRKKKTKLKQEKNLADENAFLQMKLMAEKGAVFGGGEEVPPDIMNEFLRQVEQFESQYQQGKRVTLGEFLGNPSFKNVNDIPDEELETELNKLLAMLNGNQVSLDTLCEVPSRELYRFITQELVLSEIDDVRVEGMMHCFTYEEFHPNAEYDIDHTISDIFDCIRKNNFEFEQYCFFEKIKDENGESVGRDDFIHRLKTWIELSSIEELTFEKVSISFEEESGKADYRISYLMNDEWVRGNVRFLLRKDELGYWCIEQMLLPGFNTL